MSNQEAGKNLVNGETNGFSQDGSSNAKNELGCSKQSPNLSLKHSPLFGSRKNGEDKPIKDFKPNKDHSLKSNSNSQSLSESVNSIILKDHQCQENKIRSSKSSDKKQSNNQKKAGKSDRSKKRFWYSNILYPTYKSRSDDFKRIFKNVPSDERLIVDYSCALQREILVHGRLYVSQNYVCFYANIFMWETLVSLHWKDITSITKEKTALVIPNAILICTASDKFFLTSFGSRDKTFMMLFKIWQNTLMEESMSMTDMWKLVHDCYGEELGFISDDEEYISSRLPVQRKNELFRQTSLDSLSERDIKLDKITPSFASIASLLPPSPMSGARSRGSTDPTDISGSSESEAENYSGTLDLSTIAICNSMHNGKPLVKETVQMAIDQLFTLLFTNSKFYLDFHTARKTRDLVQPDWVEEFTTGRKTRTVSLTVALTQTIGPKTSQVTETQVLLPCSTPGQLYCIDVETTNAGIPYADSFSVMSHYCLSRISENESSFELYSEIKYKKNVWGLVKSFIEKNCWASMLEFFNSLVKALAVECEENRASNEVGKQKTKRQHRVSITGTTFKKCTPENTAFKHQPTITSLLSASGIRTERGTVISWILLVAVLCLMIINVVLCYKVWSAEDTSMYTAMDLNVLKNTPRTEDDWINLLQQQESLHNIEVKKWQRVLHTAAQLLRQTEESLTQLQMSIHPTTTEKMFSGLNPHNSQNDQHKSEF